MHSTAGGNIAGMLRQGLRSPPRRVFGRGADGLFTLHHLTGLPPVDLASIGCSLPAGEIFDRLDPLVQGPLPGV